jgi:hypothetical protein
MRVDASVKFGSTGERVDTFRARYLAPPDETDLPRAPLDVVPYVRTLLIHDWQVVRRPRVVTVRQALAARADFRERLVQLARELKDGGGRFVTFEQLSSPVSGRSGDESS